MVVVFVGHDIVVVVVSEAVRKTGNEKKSQRGKEMLYNHRQESLARRECKKKGKKSRKRRNIPSYSLCVSVEHSVRITHA